MVHVEGVTYPHLAPPARSTAPRGAPPVRRPRLRTILRWATGLLIIVHGLIHVLGTVEGFGWADVEQLEGPISAAMGAAWLAAGMLTLVAGVLLIARSRRWWMVGAVAALSSQLVIITSWSDAGAGTIANVVVLIGVVHAFASQGPGSARARFGSRAACAVAASRSSGELVTDADLEHLPAPVSAYLRRTGSVGQPRVANFRAHVHGRIRAGADTPWMSFVAEQVNTYEARPQRLFFMDATMYGLPVDVLHEFVDGAATMRVKACSLLTMVDASGHDLTRAETVTVFNDMCIFAPAALVDAPIEWMTIDDQHVVGTYRAGENTISAELVFDDDGDLVDFVSDDRLAASADGTTFTPRRWSTPIQGYRDVAARRLATVGEGRWHTDDSSYTYLELHLHDITYNVATDERS